MKSLKKIGRVFAMHWSENIQYRTDTIMWALASVVTPFISLALWYKVGATSAQGPSPQEVLAYYLVLIITSQLTFAWHGFFMSQDILDGKIIKHLLRPFPYFWHPVANNIIQKFTQFPLVLVGILMIAALAPSSISQVVATSQLGLYSISLLLGILLSFFLTTVLGLTAFWLENAGEIIRFKFLFESIASGLLIPYAFMPNKVASVLSLLPFRYMFAAPTEILIGQTAGGDAIEAIIIQLVWVFALSGITHVMWIRGLKRYAVPGQ